MGRILLIEDDSGTQLLLQSRLKDLGHEVVTAPTGAMGVMEARSGSFDLFLVDVMLGSGIDGYEVCRRLKGMPHVHGVPIVMISAIVKNREDLHKGYEAGCEQFLLKGDMTLLEDVVRAMLRLKSLQDELAIQNRLRVTHFVPGPQILDPRLVEHVAADLAAPADIGFAVFQRLRLGITLLQLQLIELGFHLLHRLIFVLVLRTVVLTLSHGVGRQVGNTYRGFRPVNVLTTST